jgi:flavin reductase (DIM6/NTAB) family NADH-FMN oxidoreductase RutF
MQIDPKDYDSRRLYHLLMSCVTPRPIAWVSTVSRDKIRNLAPFSYFNAVTSKPPLLSIAVGRRRGKRKDTAANASSTGELVVNIVTEALLDKMVETSAEVGPEVDEIATAGLTVIESVVVKPPRIAEAPIQLECRTREIFEISPGIVDLVIAEVVMFHVSDELPIDEDLHIPAASLRPVARLGGADYAFLGKIQRRDRPGK